MGSALAALIELVTLDPVGEDRFRGRAASGDGWDAVYGGHFLGQATAAVCATVGAERRIHSLHAYFLRAGRAEVPIDYDVVAVRDGRSFCTRRVTATQDGGDPLFELTASFCVPEEGRVIRAAPPEDFSSLADPEDLLPYPELMATHDPLPFPEGWALKERGIDVRVVDAPWAPGGPSRDGGIRTWIRADGPLPDDPALHAALFAYQSDDSISDNVLVPFDVTWSTPDTVVFSLDHALWFHRPVRMDEWLFVEQWPVTAAGGRGLATARVWDRRGELVASFTQEALVRV